MSWNSTLLEKARAATERKLWDEARRNLELQVAASPSPPRPPAQPVRLLHFPVRLPTTGFPGRVNRGRWTSHPNTLIHRGIKGHPSYGTLPGCRIKSVPGCDTRAVPGQCSFPRARARELCQRHPRCAGFSCNKPRRDCQARDAAEIRTLVPHGGFNSERRQ